ncbi:uncharacterized protein TA13985 [Theileria annulata]|uniref:Uncharacterized protein n=1 Tax=Theileria annulata TaxID=5874 RepID=Q4UET8_THEAN|nr:uncharacterized protein TA13985 [Theileria annulata]CAI74401.1 hypothetical protein TA13985 [Theileria annulata]|eukprot:XP_952133.1 hypothetical protein TA13985 [Theileria annulata]
MKNINSPLSCCILPDQNMNPVFKQQYVTEGGKMKMTVPLSPMHYITNAKIYTYDDRFPPRFDPTYGYFNDRICKARNVDYEYKQKFVTPTVSFTRPRRNLTAQMNDNLNQGNLSQVIDNLNQDRNLIQIDNLNQERNLIQVNGISRCNSINFNQILTSINEKLSRIEFMCKNNQEDIYELKQLIKSTQTKNVMNEGTKLVIRKLNPFESVDGKIIKSEDMCGNSKNNKSLTNNTLINLVSDFTTHKTVDFTRDKIDTTLKTLDFTRDKIDSRDKTDSRDGMDEISELKKSNDLLERYIRNVKIDDLCCLENKLDVMSSDFAKIHSEIQNFPDKPKDVSLLSNLESKFKKILSKFDSNDSETSSKHNQHNDVETIKSVETTNLQEPVKSVESPNLQEPLQSVESPNTLESTDPPELDPDLPKLDSNSTETELNPTEMELNSTEVDNMIINPIESITSESNDSNSTMCNKLSGCEMNILKGLPDEVKASLTEDEVKFLQNLKSQNLGNSNLIDVVGISLESDTNSLESHWIKSLDF